MVRFLLPLAALVTVPPLASAAEVPSLHPTIPLLDVPTTLPAEILAVSPDSRWAALHRWPYPATGTPPLTVQFWDLKTGALVRSVSITGKRLWYPYIWSPDSRLFSLHVERGKESVWVVIDVATGRYREYPDLKVGPVGFTADGTGLYALAAPAYTGKDATVQLWSLPDGKKVREFTVHNLRRFTLAPDGKTAHHYTDNGRHEVWDFEAGKRLATLTGEGKEAEHRHEFVGFADGGKKVVTSYFGVRLWVFDAKTGKRERVIELPKPPNTTPDRVLGVSDDLSAVLAKTDANEPCVFEPGKDRFRCTIPAAGSIHPGWAFLTRDGERFIRPHPEYGPEVFDAVSGRRLHTLRPDTQHVRSLAFAADGKTLAAAVANDPRQRAYGVPEDPPAGHLLVWDAATGELRKGIPGIDAAVCAVFPASDGTKAVAITGKGWLGWSDSGPQGAELWDLAAGKRLKTIATEKENLYGFVGSANGRQLAAVVNEKRKQGDFFAVFPVGTRVWNLGTGDRERDIGAAPDTAVLAFSPDGERLLAMSRRGAVEAWGVESGKSRVVFTPRPPGAKGKGGAKKDGGPPFIPVALPRGDGFVALTGASTYIHDPVRLYTDNRQIAFGRIDMRPGPLAVSPDGKWAAASERPYVGPARVFVWKIPEPPPLDEKTIKDGVIPPEEAWVEPVVLHGHTGQIHALAFSPDGKTLATGGEDCAVRMWDVPTGRLKATLWAPPSAHPGGAPKDWVAYTPEGFFAGTPRGRAFLRFTDATPSTFFGLREPAPSVPASDLEKQFLSPAKVKDSLGAK